MFLKSIEVESFRNLTGKITCCNGINILFGNNGQGKTNWLEAIQLLAHAKSFRTSRLQEAVRFGETTAALRGVVRRGDSIDRDVRVSIQHGTKQTYVNNKREPLAKYLAHLHAVWFTADELEVVRGGPEARRSFLDRGVVSLHPAYAQTISEYNKVIKQKKRLLEDALEGRWRLDQLADALEPWNQQLVSLGTQIHRARKRYVSLLQQALEHSLFGDALSIHYLSSLEGKGDLEKYRDVITDRLRLRMDAEMYAGACLIGPHRDDLEILSAGRNLRSFGSSGQQRSALITLDLAVISVYYSKVKEYPIFLIDDVDAELDGIRIERLLEYLDGRTQTFVTTSKRNHFERFAQRAKFYEVRDGRVTEETGDNAAMMSVGNVI